MYRYLDTHKPQYAYTPQTKPRSFVIFDGLPKHRLYVQQAVPARYGPFGNISVCKYISGIFIYL